MHPLPISNRRQEDDVEGKLCTIISFYIHVTTRSGVVFACISFVPRVYADLPWTNLLQVVYAGSFYSHVVFALSLFICISVMRPVPSQAQS